MFPGGPGGHKLQCCQICKEILWPLVAQVVTEASDWVVLTLLIS
jgi:hypothetical protein